MQVADVGESGQREEAGPAFVDKHSYHIYVLDIFVRVYSLDLKNGSQNKTGDD